MDGRRKGLPKISRSLKSYKGTNNGTTDVGSQGLRRMGHASNFFAKIELFSRSFVMDVKFPLSNPLPTLQHVSEPMKAFTNWWAKEDGHLYPRTAGEKGIVKINST